MKYNLLKHLSNDSKVEFKDLVSNNAQIEYNRSSLTCYFTDYIKNYINEFKELMKGDLEEIEFPISRSIKDTSNMIIEVRADELTEISISVTNINLNKFKNEYMFDCNQFMNYTYHHLYHYCIFNTYNDHKVKEFAVQRTTTQNNVYFILKSKDEILL